MSHGVLSLLRSQRCAYYAQFPITAAIAGLAFSIGRLLYFWVRFPIPQPCAHRLALRTVQQEPCARGYLSDAIQIAVDEPLGDWFWLLLKARLESSSPAAVQRIALRVCQPHTQWPITHELQKLSAPAMSLTVPGFAVWVGRTKSNPQPTHAVNSSIKPLLKPEPSFCTVSARTQGYSTGEPDNRLRGVGLYFPSQLTLYALALRWAIELIAHSK